VTGSQIWLNPLLDDCQTTYTTNLKKEKEKEKKKKKDLSGCGNDWHFMVDGINIARDLKMGRGTSGTPYDGP
jgi:hypothetical protein